MAKFLLVFIVLRMMLRKNALSVIVGLLVCVTVSYATSVAVDNGANVNVADFDKENQKEVIHDESRFQIPVYSNDIAAIVNNEVITMAQVMREVAFFLPRIQMESRSQQEFQKKFHACQDLILNALIERILIVADFNSRGGKIPENYEQREYEMHIRDRFNDDRVAFAKYLRESGQSMRDFKKDIRDSAIVGFIMHELQNNKPEVSPAKIKAYYDSHIADFILDRQIFVHKIEILKWKYSDDERKNKLDKIFRALSSEESIQEVVKKFCDSPKTSTIGWVSSDDMIPEFSTAVKGLSVGEFTQGIEMQDKIIILFVSGEKPAKKFTLEEVSEDIQKKLAAEFQMESKNNYINKLKKKSYIKIFLNQN